MEGIGFVCLYFLLGKLPWQGLPAKTKKEKYDQIRDKKRDTPIEDLCEGLPNEFVKYFNYCRALNFEDKPCISDLRKLFKMLMKKKDYEYDYKYDWVIKKESKTKEISPPAPVDDYKDKLRKKLNQKHNGDEDGVDDDDMEDQ